MTSQKSLLVININNVIDIITNSSSELFVMQGESLSIVEEMVTNVYPHYKNEYEDLVCIKNASLETKQTYIWAVLNIEIDSSNLYNNMDAIIKLMAKAKVLASKYNMEVTEFFKHYGNSDEEFVDMIIKDSNDDFKCVWFDTELSEKAVDKILEPYDGSYVLMSLEENPDWEYQEKLELIGDRYHLG